MEKENKNKLVIEQSLLTLALSAATKAVQRRNNIPILSHVLLQANGDYLKIIATDLDIQISTTVSCSSIGNFETVLPGHTLNDTIRKLSGADQITFIQDVNTSTLEADRSFFKFQAMLPADFPSIKVDAEAYSFTIAFQEFDKILNSVLFAASTDETRYYLNGIHLHAEADENTLIAVATDGHRLSKLKISVGKDISKMPPIIVPRSLWNTVKGIFSEKEEIQIYISESKIILEQSSISIISKLVDGTFPEYQRVIPEENPHFYNVNKAALIAAINRVSTIHNVRGHAVSFSFNDGKLVLATKENALGEAQAEIDLLEGSSTESVTVGFNGKYALDMLSAIKADTLTFKLYDKTKPARIEDPGDEAATFVLMPMRL